MSGGYFDYEQYKIGQIADQIEHFVMKKPVDDDNDYYREFSEETFEEFKKGVELLREAEIYAQRIDWFLSGDDGEESFHRRLKQELTDLKLRQLSI